MNFVFDLDGFKYNIKPVYAVDLAKQTSRIQEVAEIIRELELNQALAEVTKLLHLILTTPATFASCETLFYTFKNVNNYMRYSESEKAIK